MKKELLLSTLILTSPIAHITAQAASEMRASILESIKKGEKKVFHSGVIGKTKGNGLNARIRVTLEKPDLFKSPNRIKPEFGGKIELIDDNGNVIHTLDSGEGDYIFDLVHSDDYSNKYVAYGCSSTMECSHNGSTTLEYLKDDAKFMLILPTPYELDVPQQFHWLELN